MVCITMHGIAVLCCVVRTVGQIRAIRKTGAEAGKPWRECNLGKGGPLIFVTLRVNRGRSAPEHLGPQTREMSYPNRSIHLSLVVTREIALKAASDGLI